MGVEGRTVGVDLVEEHMRRVVGRGADVEAQALSRIAFRKSSALSRTARKVTVTTYTDVSGIMRANLVGGVLVVADALVVKELIQLARERHLGNDVAAADELTLHIELRDGGPVGEVLNSLADFIVERIR